MSCILLDMVEENEDKLSFEDVDKGLGFGLTSPEHRRGILNQVVAITQNRNDRR